MYKHESNGSLRGESKQDPGRVLINGRTFPRSVCKVPAGEAVSPASLGRLVPDAHRDYLIQTDELCNVSQKPCPLPSQLTP